MDQPYLGRYASVENYPKSTKWISYFRGYGNIIVHTMNPDQTLTTGVMPYNRIQPLTAPFGEHYPPVAPGDIPQFNPQTTIAWLPPSVPVATPSPMRVKEPSVLSASIPTQA